MCRAVLAGARARLVCAVPCCERVVRVGRSSVVASWQKQYIYRVGSSSVYSHIETVGRSSVVAGWQCYYTTIYYNFFIKMYMVV